MRLYRWFHDGCCECVGNTCINYGINESRCLECPGKDDEQIPVEGEAFLSEDYESADGGETADKEAKAAKAGKVAEPNADIVEPSASV